MSLPLPPQSFKQETKKSQSSKIVFNDHDQSEKRGENYQAKITPSSPQRPLKKRSALEDLTNASESQPAQFKKEANKEFVKDVSKKINRNTTALGLTENNEMNIKKYKLEPLPVAISTTMISNIVDKLILENSTTSQTLTTEEASLFKKPLVLKEQPTNRDIILIKRSLSLKKHTNQGEMALLEKPLSLQEETDSGDKSVVEPMTFVKKHKTEEAAITERAFSLNKMCAYQGKQSFCGEELALQDITVEEDSFFMEPMNFTNKPKTEEATSTKRLLTLKKKCTTQGEMSHKKKPLVLQKTTSGEKSLIKELLSFKEKPSTEESLFQEPSPLQEKHTTQGKVSILKNPLALQKTPTEKESLLMEPLVFKKSTIEQATDTKKLVFLKKKCTTQSKMSCLKKPLVLQTISEEKALIKKILPFKKELTTEEESLFKESSVLQEKHTTQREVAFLKKSWALQENSHSKDEFFMEPFSFRKKHTTNEAVSTKEPLSLKKKYAIQMMMPICRELVDLQNMIGKNKDSFSMELVSFREKSLTGEAVHAKTSLSLKKKQITQGKMLVLKRTTSEDESLFKKLLPFEQKPTTDEEFFFQDPSVLKRKHTTPQELSLAKKSLAFQEKTTIDEESYVKEQMEEKPTTEGGFLFQEPFSLHVKPTNKDKLLFWKSLNLQNEINTKEKSWKKLLTLQEKSTTEKESLFKKPLVLKKKLSTEATTSIESQSSLKKKPTVQGEVFFFNEQLALQKNTTDEKESLIKQPLTLQENPNSEKEALFKEPLAFQGQFTISEAFHFKEIFSLNEKPTTGQELSYEKPLALQEVLTHKEDTFLKDFSILQVENSPHMFNTTTESRTGMSSTATMSSVSKFSTTSKSNACEFISNRPFSSWDKRSQNEQITPLEWIDNNHSNPLFNSIYAKDIFSYMKEREEHFILEKYMNRQTDISSDMRVILVDWLVEVQMTFEVSHETLYLAVKLVDHYLMKVICKRDKLQLLGSTAFLIAAKFEEPYPPCLDEFLYICDDMYQRDEMLAMEISILQTLKFDINIPTAYHFLRRYAMCIHASMKTLTLSRFICEMTLLEYDYIQERASKLAAGSFLLALYMQKLGHWAPTLEYYSGYKTSDIHPLVKQLNILLTLRSCDRFKTVLSKYSHEVFFEVTRIPPLDMLKLEEILNSC
ncbi:G2/mitotic-specific cyclin-B3 isoform X1 [Pteropus vampyrus]|uniref:G2/mitotic-specific cyclin-B3 isoform X1 n=1 Tax=Pteropus vampyrus TaxID=132908 RepID=A0A6P6C4L0_PTEVA|nr:G2/mitotic-specific cyclin-B3 isoform X1 [Pteropus vampyrus]XP_023382259.1 G2/mitotic-specific cyclin-B3 isoform X1 [Pteropus vampyrus]XP_023382260.1 G2/mitotic-specific cyclin-B3 isoform X1 [Pteropus vampyrus]